MFWDSKHTIILIYLLIFLFYFAFVSAIDGIYFTSTRKYIESFTTVRDRIAAIDRAIDALILLCADTEIIEKQYIDEYSLDDGQTKIRAKYRNIESIQASIEALYKVRNLLVNRRTGRHFRLVDGRNFTGTI
jgi:hypothetical protein